MFGPFEVIGAIAGAGFEIAGGLKSYGAAQKENQYQQQIIGLEEQQEDVRRHAMELMANRQLIQNARNVQMTQAMARATATGQGAQFGSGLAGGLGQISGQGTWNSQGVTQNLELGEQMADLTRKIDTAKIGMSQQQSQYMAGQALSGIGKGIMGSMGAISGLGGNIWGGGGDWSKGFWSSFGTGGGDGQ